MKKRLMRWRRERSWRANQRGIEVQVPLGTYVFRCSECGAVVVTYRVKEWLRCDKHLEAAA